MNNRRRAPVNRTRRKKIGNKPITTDIKTLKVKELESNAHFASRIGLPLNYLVTIRHEDIDALTIEDKNLRREADLNRLKQFARDNQFETAFIWSRESERRTGYGEHVHILIHIPSEFHSRFEKNLGRWPANVNVKPADYTRTLYPSGKVGSAIGYVLKNAPWAAHNTSRMSKAGGPIVGKRCGCSRNIDVKAQDKFSSRNGSYSSLPKQTIRFEDIIAS